VLSQLLEMPSLDRGEEETSRQEQQSTRQL